MIDKNIILKSLEDSIIKCRKPSYSLSSLSNHIKHSMNSFAESTRDLEYEKSILIDDKGNVVKENTDNDNYSVYSGESDYLADKTFDNPNIQKLISEFEDKTQLIYDTVDDIGESYSMVNKLDKEYHDKIADYLNENNINVNIDHNHPGAYGKRDSEGNIHNIDLDYNVFSCLSKSDVKSLLQNVEIGATGIYMSNMVKSITCECSNGSRMTLTRIDGTSDNNFVIDDYIAKEFGGQPPKHTREEFDETYNMLKSDWQTMLHGFNNDYREHMNNWANKNNTKYNNRNEYTEEYNKEASKFRKNYARNNKTWNDNLKFDIDAFKEIGFELSMEWVR